MQGKVVWESVCVCVCTRFELSELGKKAAGSLAAWNLIEERHMYRFVPIHIYACRKTEDYI